MKGLRPLLPESVSRMGAMAAALAAVVTGVGEALLLSFDSQWFRTLGGWFYLPLARPRPMGPAVAWVVLSAAAIAAFVAVARMALARRPCDVVRRVAAVVLAGVGMQVGFALIEGRGLFAIRDRLLGTGHSEFARTAAAGLSIHDVLCRYEAMVSTGQLGPFERTKPPGTLFFYVATERLAHALLPFDATEERLQWLATFATFTWPLVSMLSLVPLFILGRAIADSERAMWACALSIATPSFLLITLQTDEVLFPLIVNASLACAVWSARRQDLRLGFLAGVLGYLAAWCSFGLIAAALLLLTCVALGAYLPDRRTASFAIASRVCGAIAIGMLGAWTLTRVAFGYDFVRRYQVALRAHEAWQTWKGTPYEITHFPFLNVAEFVTWIGAPIALLAATGAIIGLVELGALHKPKGLLLATALVATVALLARFGHTKAETPRLWLFLAQPAALAASLTLQRLLAPRGRVAFYAVWLTQFVITLDIKRFQDFF